MCEIDSVPFIKEPQEALAEGLEHGREDRLGDQGQQAARSQHQEDIQNQGGEPNAVRAWARWR